MKTVVIIPFYKQAKNISKILKGLEKQTVIPDSVFLMIDRPQQDTDYNDEITKEIEESTLNTNIYKIDKLPLYIGNPNDDKELFLAPYIRNSGIDIALRENIYDNFIFIDGDCVPQETLVESHISKLKINNIPVLTVGRRREYKYRWQDKRESDSNLCHLEMFREKGLLINNPELIKNALVVWSCNMGLNKKAINILKKFNKKYYNRNEVFNSEFNGKWGGEDAFLGIEAWYCRIFINTIGDRRSGVEHIDHERPEDKYNINIKDFFDNQTEKLKKLVRIKPLSLDLFI